MQSCPEIATNGEAPHTRTCIRCGVFLVIARSTAELRGLFYLRADVPSWKLRVTPLKQGYDYRTTRATATLTRPMIPRSLTFLRSCFKYAAIRIGDSQFGPYLRLRPSSRSRYEK